MEKKIISSLRIAFEDCAHKEGELEFWFARDLQRLLEYDKWGNFLNVIEKAKVSAKNSGEAIKDHFADVSKMVEIGSEAVRQIEDIMLTPHLFFII